MMMMTLDMPKLGPSQPHVRRYRCHRGADDEVGPSQQHTQTRFPDCPCTWAKMRSRAWSTFHAHLLVFI